MNILCVILSIILLHLGICGCNNVTSYISNKDAVGVCYSCTSCPRPFDPDPSYVTQVYSPTGWCARWSRSDEAGATYMLNAAPAGMCYTKGCSWQMYNGSKTWMCCCNDNLCNSDPPTTVCYSCSNCPISFSPNAWPVSETNSRTGWCYRRSNSNTYDGTVDRGADILGLCMWNECSWKRINGKRFWVCCCNGDKCNTATSISKSVINILSVAIITIVLFRANFFILICAMFNEVKDVGDGKRECL